MSLAPLVINLVESSIRISTSGNLVVLIRFADGDCPRLSVSPVKVRLASLPSARMGPSATTDSSVPKIARNAMALKASPLLYAQAAFGLVSLSLNHLAF